VHVLLHKALKQAVDDGLLPRNVTEAVKAPRQSRKEILALNPEQARAFLQTTRGDRLEALYVLAIHTGLRQSELLGLKWEDVDLEDKGLSVRRILSAEGRADLYHPEEQQEPQRATHARSRRNPARSQTTPIRRTREARRSLEGSRTDVLHPGRHPSEPQQHPHPFLQAAGQTCGPPPNLLFHDLRHTFATLMLKGGEHPKVVQEMMGHATINITLDTYSHVLPDMQDNAADRLGALLS
jgi:integrase